MNRFHRAYMAGNEDQRQRAERRSRPTMAEPPMKEEAMPERQMALAMIYVEPQAFVNLYSPEEGWKRGTIFADLDKPFEGGCCR